jgi:hypothetical protein
MKKFVLILAALGLLALAGCKDLTRVKVTYRVYSEASDAAAMPDASIIYRDSDGSDHAATAKVSPGFEHSMTVQMGTHINLRGVVTLPSKECISSLSSRVLINDNVIAERLGDCSNGAENTDGTYDLVCDFQGEARGVPQ